MNAYELFSETEIKDFFHALVYDARIDPTHLTNICGSIKPEHSTLYRHFHIAIHQANLEENKRSLAYAINQRDFSSVQQFFYELLEKKYPITENMCLQLLDFYKNKNKSGEIIIELIDKLYDNNLVTEKIFDKLFDFFGKTENLSLLDQLVSPRPYLNDNTNDNALKSNLKHGKENKKEISQRPHKRIKVDKETEQSVDYFLQEVRNSMPPSVTTFGVFPQPERNAGQLNESPKTELDYIPLTL